MGNWIEKKVQGLIVGSIKRYIKEKCNIEVPSVKVNAIISDSADSENFTMIAERLCHMLREDGIPEEIAGELMRKFPELVQNIQTLVNFIDSEFSNLQTSVIVIQEQMHTDKIKDVETILIQIEKYKEEKDIIQDDWKGLAERLEEKLNRLEGEIENNINICNKAPREMNNVKGILSTLKFFLSKDINSKQIETSLKIIGEALMYYEKGTKELFDIEMCSLNRINSAKKTLNKAIGFISENFLNGGDENDSNIMEWLTDEETWTKNPKAFCDNLNQIIPKLEEKVI